MNDKKSNSFLFYTDRLMCKKILKIIKLFFEKKNVYLYRKLYFFHTYLIKVNNSFICNL